jgi:hypothetical protein
MIISKHADLRIRQRGFSTESIELIWNYGRETFAPGGAVKYFFGKKESKFALDKMKERVQFIERAKGRTIVVIEGSIITAYKK